MENAAANLRRAVSGFNEALTDVTNLGRRRRRYYLGELADAVLEINEAYVVLTRVFAQLPHVYFRPGSAAPVVESNHPVFGASGDPGRPHLVTVIPRWAGSLQQHSTDGQFNGPRETILAFELEQACRVHSDPVFK